MVDAVIQPSELRARLNAVRGARGSIGFVPTMGALHAGHARLLEVARRENRYLVASIFVNPLQFDRQDDLDSYPRTWDADVKLCRQHGVDLIFAPTPATLYPRPQLTFVDSPSLGEHLCGAYRPGHFRGVATVVMKLLNLVQPYRAYFGEKDAQQLAILRRMVQDLDLPVEIVAVPTVREPDGLALSSRNLRLTAEQRTAAPGLYRALCEAMKALEEGEDLASEARHRAVALLPEREDARLEYFELVDPETLQPVERVRGQVLIAAAFWLGAVRLIDNVTWPGRN